MGGREVELVFWHLAPQLRPIGPFFSAAGRTRLLLVLEPQCHKSIHNRDLESDYKPATVLIDIRIRDVQGKQALPVLLHQTFARNEPRKPPTKKSLKNYNTICCIHFQTYCSVVCGWSCTICCRWHVQRSRWTPSLLLIYCFWQPAVLCEEKYVLYLYFGVVCVGGPYLTPTQSYNHASPLIKIIWRHFSWYVIFGAYDKMSQSMH